jgi:hypothetical protein
MTFTQTAQECQEHPGCTVVIGYRDDRETWRSHMPANIPAGVRLNLDYPTAGRERWKLASPEEATVLGWTPEEHRRRAFDARQRDLFTAQELAVIKDVIGVTAVDLELEANERGWDKPLGRDRTREQLPRERGR